MEEDNVFEPVYFMMCSAGRVTKFQKIRESFQRKQPATGDRANRPKAWQTQFVRDRNTVVQKKSGVVHLEILNIHTHM